VSGELVVEQGRQGRLPLRPDRRLIRRLCCYQGIAWDQPLTVGHPSSEADNATL